MAKSALVFRVLGKLILVGVTETQKSLLAVDIPLFYGKRLQRDVFKSSQQVNR